MTAPNFTAGGQSAVDSTDPYTPYPSRSSYATLAEYLWKTPFIFNGRFDDDTRAAIIAECYQSLWQYNPTLMHQYFFKNQNDLQDAIRAQLHDMTGREYSKMAMDDPSSLIWHTNGLVPSPDLSSERGRQCGHVFRKGEPVYRCRKGS
ncbi:hypothetical protein BDB00DRAFT_610080 [Zychaea mexicana]|uniref:uncharacterized protein n=1 Tax=Zychaea mexicana TaxID=64656 RepID=UPI0022FDCBF2|nr:uncharacterized protein BDB00DRAFT_610080 [Zychaea mexicana]KAI9489595.1 hypothetical protein BDB00DRAFT_610080 [Zychaea mexicana]